MQNAVEILAHELDAIHAALCEGRIADLEGRTEALVAAMEMMREDDAPALEMIRGKADRNAVCLEGAMRGLRAARRRIAEIRAIEAGSATYDPQGRRDASPVGQGSLAQRI